MPAAGWAVPTAVVAVAAVGVATLTAPGAAGLGGRYGWTQLISFRAVLGLGGLTGGLALVPIGWGLRGHPRAAATVAGLAAVGLASAAGQLAVLRGRGFHSGGRRGARETVAGSARGGGSRLEDRLPRCGAAWLPLGDGGGNQLTVVVANALHSSADPGALIALLLRAGADVVAMPETDPVLAGAVAAGLAAAGRPMQVFGTPTAGEVAPTALLVTAALGEYERVVVTAAGESAAVRAGGSGHGTAPATGHGTTTGTGTGHGTGPATGTGPDVGPDLDFAPCGEALQDRGAGAPGTVLVRPRGPAGGRPVFAAVHPYPPRSRPLTRVWRARSAEVVGLLDAHPGAVVAGDFNATLDHPALRAAVRRRRPEPVTDAAQQVGAAAIGTWPSSRPAWIGTPIDHVLFDARAWRATSVRVEHIPGSDHRALIACLETVETPVGPFATPTRRAATTIT